MPKAGVGPSTSSTTHQHHIGFPLQQLPTQGSYLAYFLSSTISTPTSVYTSHPDLQQKRKTVLSLDKIRMKMDEKLAKYDKFGRPAHATMKLYSRPSRRFRPLLIMTLVVLCFYYVRPAATFDFLPQVARLAPTHAPATQKTMANTNALVPLEAHIMSKCPDARDCLRQLVLPTMQRVIDKVNFTLSYLGTPTENDGVDCKHGPEECTLAQPARGSTNETQGLISGGSYRSWKHHAALRRQPVP